MYNGYAKACTTTHLSTQIHDKTLTTSSTPRARSDSSWSLAAVRACALTPAPTGTLMGRSGSIDNVFDDVPHLLRLFSYHARVDTKRAVVNWGDVHP